MVATLQSKPSAPTCCRGNVLPRSYGPIRNERSPATDLTSNFGGSPVRTLDSEFDSFYL